MIWLLRLTAIAMLTFSVALPAVAESSEYAVVSSAENRASEVDASLVRLLYLKELSEWPTGTSARPIGRAEGSPEDRLLLESVLEMDAARLAQHWISLKQRTGQRKVRRVESSEKVVLLLKHYPGAFAVLPIAIAEADPGLVVLLRL